MSSVREIREQMVKFHQTNLKAQKDGLLVTEFFLFVVKDVVFMSGLGEFLRNAFLQQSTAPIKHA